MRENPIHQEWSSPASCGVGTVYSQLWAAESPKAVVILAHGMAEHSDRYSHFAGFLAGHGFAVGMNDHPGHGKSTQPKGHFADDKGWEHTVEELYRLRLDMEKKYPGMPLLLMGHSMGSFLSRSYLTRHGEELSGCVLCGTMGSNPALPLAKFLAGMQKKILGPGSPGKFLDKLTSAGNNSRIENPVNQFAWLSTLDQVCMEYEADENCGFVFTAAGYYDLFSGLLEVNGKAWASQVPKSLPIYLVAGGQDPIGAYGKGPAEVAEKLKNAGCSKVTLKIHPPMRHELLNEQGKEEVYQEILEFLESCLPTPSSVL